MNRNNIKNIRTYTKFILRRWKSMVDYKKMYSKIMGATEQSMEILIKAQQECEEMYVSAWEKEFDEEKHDE